MLIYCDAHAAQPLGPVIYDSEPPLRDGVFFFGQYKRRTDHGPVPRWVPDTLLADYSEPGGKTVWTRRGQRYLDVQGQPIPLSKGDVHQKSAALRRAQELAEDGDVLNRPHVVFRHRGCRRSLRLSEDRLTRLLDSLAANGITGVSLAYLELMNTRL